jgi:uncharacterized protein
MRRSPQRSCIGCRAVRDKKDLVRLVHTPEGDYRLDPTGKLSGRGAYLCSSLDCLSGAVKRRAFDRAFRGSVPREQVEALMEEMAGLVQTRENERIVDGD